jgi:hypothetical protein
LQLQKLFQITPSFSTYFLGVFLTPYQFFLGIYQFWQLILSWKINYQRPTYRPPHFRLGPPIAGHWAHRHHTPTDSMTPRAFTGTAVPTGPVQRHHFASTVNVVVPPSHHRPRQYICHVTTVVAKCRSPPLLTAWLPYAQVSAERH